MTPIVLFVYQRPQGARKVIESLLRYSDMTGQMLYIFSDAAKGEFDREDVEEVRHFIREVKGFGEVRIIERDVHLGLAGSIIQGVSHVLSKYGSAIVLEDDLVPRRGFFEYISKALQFYQDDKRVFSISGFSYGFSLPDEFPHDVYPLTRGCSWGWATWSDRWFNVDWRTSEYTARLADKEFRQALTRSGSDIRSLLERQSRGKIDSWAIRWYCHQVLHGLLTIYPRTTLIDNDGFDDKATHTKVYNRYRSSASGISRSPMKFAHFESPIGHFQLALKKKFSIPTRMVEGRLYTYLMRLGVISQ